MKNRIGFVSNSSSSSFILQKFKMTDLQLAQVMDYTNTLKQFNLEDDGWSVTDDGEFIRGDTVLDNGDFDKMLKAINLNHAAIVDYNYY